MGNGYRKASPPCPFWKEWIFRFFLLPLAKRKLDNRLSKSLKKDLYFDGMLADWAYWHGYYVCAFRRAPDARCTDPLADGRNPKFTLTMILEGEPELFPPERFYAFIKQCIDQAFDIMTPGVNPNLKIAIPSEFFSED